MAKWKKRWLNNFFLIISHSAIGVVGFTLGVYTLPILTAPEKPAKEIIDTVIDNAVYKAVFVKQLKGSDFFHWGQGQISISNNKSVFVGKLSPGPVCKLYFAKKFVNDEISFLKEKNNSLLLSDVKSFNSFAVSLPQNVNLDMYTSIVIWCEAFSEFITSAQYRY